MIDTYMKNRIKNNNQTMIGGVKMKRIFKNNKGFSMIELMVGLLIVAVISAAALAMMGGLLNTGRMKADRQSAETIRNAIKNYIDASNDSNLSMLGVTSGTTTGAALMGILDDQIIVTGNNGTFTSYVFTRREFAGHALGAANAFAGAAGNDNGGFGDDETGTYGPFLDGDQELLPQQSGVEDGWDIDVYRETGQVTVQVTRTAADAVVTIH